jgi:hypothetical protein
MYLTLGFCVLLVEKSPIPPGAKMKLAEIRLAASMWDFSFSFGLQEVYALEIIFHFIVVVIVALIFYWMTGVRRAVTKQRLKELPD